MVGCKHEYHIIGHNLCPYVQRIVIVMMENGLPYRRTDIDLDDKPTWLQDISPTGRVPVLIVGDDRILFESGVIVDYLDEIALESLYPGDPLDKAEYRSWIEFGSYILQDIAHVIYTDKNQKSVDQRMTAINKKLNFLEEKAFVGPYFSGEKFGLADVVYATIFRYFKVFEALSSVVPLNSVPMLRMWWALLVQRTSVRDAVPVEYDELLRTFILNRGSYVSRLL